jgi:hypothetical protein
MKFRDVAEIFKARITAASSRSSVPLYTLTSSGLGRDENLIARSGRPRLLQEFRSSPDRARGLGRAHSVG